jgi:hypothetical protein
LMREYSYPVNWRAAAGLARAAAHLRPAATPPAPAAAAAASARVRSSSAREVGAAASSASHLPITEERHIGGDCIASVVTASYQ